MGLVRLAFMGLGVAVLVKILSDLDLNKTVHSHQPGYCAVVPGMEQGSEDMVLLSDGKTALVTSGLFIGSHVPQPKGRMFLFNAEADTTGKLQIKDRLRELQVLKHPNKDEFRPAGVTVFEQGAKRTVYVVNSKLHVVEVFDLDVSGGKLTYVKSISDPSFRGVNNIIATDKDKFYVSNFVYSQNAIMALGELALNLPTGSVVYYDGTKGHKVLSGLKGPNGVVLSKDKKHLFVALNVAEMVQSYMVVKPTQLQLIDAVSVGTGLDNLNIDSEGIIWTGAQPVLHMMTAHMFDPTRYHAPSQVLSIPTSPAGKFGEPVEVFADSGARLSGSTTALKVGQKLLIGTVMHRMMVCELGAQTDRI